MNIVPGTATRPAHFSITPEVMRCSTCGERLDPDDTRCPTCGAAVAVDVRRLAAPFPPAVGVKRCPRCAYRGDGIPYFRRPTHVGLLVGVSLFTYGLGGLVYWLARRNHAVCPNCGLGWEHAGRRLPSPRSTDEQDPADAVSLPPGGLGRRIAGGVMILLAFLMVFIGFAEGELALLGVASAFGVGGSGTFYWGWKALQERRQAVLTGLQRRVLLLARRKGGELTVSEVATELDLSLPAAERVLISMDDGFRVRSEVTREGLLLYEFPELRPRGEVGPGAT